MLAYKSMKNSAGIIVIGEYDTLRRMQETVHDVEKFRPGSSKDGDHLIDLAYDFRKAFERAREIIDPPVHFEEIGTRYGVKIIWPVLLMQVRQLRSYMAFGPSTSSHQACVYELEALVETAVRNEFAADAEAIFEAWRRINPVSPGVVDKMKSVGAIFCSWTDEQRRKNFIHMLDCFSPLHSSLYEMKHNPISPMELERWKHAKWVDPENGK